MLLQISEPGQSANPHEHRVAIGIDLGTTHSLVASVKSGEPVILPDEHQRTLLPSVVLYPPHVADEAAGEKQAVRSALVGWQALEHPDRNHAIFSIKRLMGCSMDDAARLKNQPNAVLANEAADISQAPLRVQTPAGGKTPVEISAEILRMLHDRARASLGQEIVGAVITVPAYFDDAQRQATKDAAQLAGLPVLRLINEPTAAALAYGLDTQTEAKNEGYFLIYDLGGGTFDVSILHFRQGVFEVLATRGNTHLGGDDVDFALSGWIKQQLNEQHSLDSNQINTINPIYLRETAKRVKEQLSQSEKAECTIEYNGSLIRLQISRAQLDKLVDPLIKQTFECVESAMKDAQLTSSQMTEVVLVGGATRMPIIRESVERWLGRPALSHINPDEVVALGAALQAHTLAGNRLSNISGLGHAQQDFLLLDVNPLSLGLETMGGLVDVIIPRNSTLPIARAQDFTTYQDGQTHMSIHVVQGEHELVSQCRSLARFRLSGIPPMTAGAARIRVRFEVDADGLLSVFATEQTTGVEASVIVKPSHGLDDETLQNLLQTQSSHIANETHSLASSLDAQAVRAIREQAVESVRLLNALNTAVEEDFALLTDPIQGGSAQARENIQIAVHHLLALLSSEALRTLFENVLPDWMKQCFNTSARLWQWDGEAKGGKSPTQDTLQINNLAQKLDLATQNLLAQSEDFAARRMNQSIAKALTGQSIDRF